MEDPSPVYRSGNIITEYNDNAEQIMNIIIDITSLFTLLSSLFIIYLIFYKSPKVMAGYKKILLIDIILEIVGVIILYIGKPKVLLKFFITFSVGLFPIQNKNITILTFVFWSNVMVWSSTCLSMIHVERYYTIHYGTKKNTGFLGPKFFVYLYFILNILITLGTVISGIFGDVFISGADFISYIARINGGMEFIRKYPGAVLLNNRRTIWIMVFYFCMIVGAVLIFVPLFTFLFLNAVKGFKAVRSNN